jgi:hypothetical protein
MFKLIILFLLAAFSSANATSGKVVMQKPYPPNNTDIVLNLTQVYENLGMQIEFKNHTEWDSMSTDDFEAYDAVLVITHQCPSYKPDDYYEPFSNYEQWGPAIRDGNSIILGTENMKQSHETQAKDMTVMHAAASYSIYNSENTGAYISIGRCLNSTWLSDAFGVENEEDRFNLAANDRNPFQHNIIVDPSNHPALTGIKNGTVDGTLNRLGHQTSLTIFTNYPPIFTAFAVSLFWNSKPFILLKTGQTSNPTLSPIAVPPKDVITVDYKPTSVPSNGPRLTMPPTQHPTVSPTKIGKKSKNTKHSSKVQKKAKKRGKKGRKV